MTKTIKTPEGWSHVTTHTTSQILEYWHPNKDIVTHLIVHYRDTGNYEIWVRPNLIPLEKIDPSQYRFNTTWVCRYSFPSFNQAYLAYKMGVK
jgi:hypothetical protein